MKQNNYSQSGIKQVSNHRYFVKIYSPEISLEKISDEFNKSKQLHDLANRSRLFLFPRPISFENNNISFELVEDFIELRCFLFKNNNLFWRD